MNFSSTYILCSIKHSNFVYAVNIYLYSPMYLTLCFPFSTSIFPPEILLLLSEELPLSITFISGLLLFNLFGTVFLICLKLSLFYYCFSRVSFLNIEFQVSSLLKMLIHCHLLSIIFWISDSHPYCSSMKVSIFFPLDAFVIFLFFINFTIFFIFIMLGEIH